LIGAYGASRDVQSGVHGKEVGRFEMEADHFHGHDRPILTPRNVGNSEGVPHDDVLLVDLTILQRHGSVKRYAIESRTQSNFFKRDVKLTAKQTRLEQNPF
jgi:hypothetical protein